MQAAVEDFGSEFLRGFQLIRIVARREPSRAIDRHSSSGTGPGCSTPATCVFSNNSPSGCLLTVVPPDIVLKDERRLLLPLAHPTSGHRSGRCGSSIALCTAKDNLASTSASLRGGTVVHLCLREILPHHASFHIRLVSRWRTLRGTPANRI